MDSIEICFAVNDILYQIGFHFIPKYLSENFISFLCYIVVSRIEFSFICWILKKVLWFCAM